jgi:hypothetical protein
MSFRMPHIADPEPTCRKCRGGMRLASTTPCAEGYLLRSYRCVDCRVTLVMVEAGPPGDLVPERRAVRRLGVTTGATIESGSGRVACVLRDVSAAGASLSAAGRGKLPQHFTLMAGGSRLPCRIIWRRDRRIGIAFD